LTDNLGLLELARAEIAQARMRPHSVVAELDIFKNAGAVEVRLGNRSKAHALFNTPKTLVLDLVENGRHPTTEN
jgi:hypothetical protein